MRLTALPISDRLQVLLAAMVYGTPAISSGSSGICSVRMKAGGLWRLQLNSFRPFIPIALIAFKMYNFYMVTFDILIVGIVIWNLLS